MMPRWVWGLIVIAVIWLMVDASGQAHFVTLVGHNIVTFFKGLGNA